MVGEIIGTVKGQMSNNRDVMVGEIIGTGKGQRSYHMGRYGSRDHM